MAHRCPKAQAQLLCHSLVSSPRVGGGVLTQLVVPGVVGDLHGVDLEPAGALPQAVRAGDGRALLVHHLHQLGGGSARVTPPPRPPPGGQGWPSSLGRCLAWGQTWSRGTAPGSLGPDPWSTSSPGAGPCSCGAGSPGCRWRPPHSVRSSCGQLRTVGRQGPELTSCQPPSGHPLHPLSGPTPALTGHGAPQHFQAHAQAAIPGERVDADEAGHHRLRELAQHGRVLVHVPVEGLGEAGLRAAPHPGPEDGSGAEGSDTYHFLVAVGVHHPCLAVIAEAHEERGHEVVTRERTVVRARLLS